MSEEIGDYTVQPGQSPPSGPPRPPTQPRPPDDPPLPDVAEVAGPGAFDPTTRLRCAGVLDAAFRNQVLMERYENAHRAGAREPGLDAQAVVGACRDARETASIAGGLLVALVLLLAVFHVFVAGFAALGLLWLALRHSWREFWRSRGGATAPAGLRTIVGVLATILLVSVLVAGFGLYSALNDPAPQYDPGVKGVAEPGSDYESSGDAAFGLLIPWWFAAFLLLTGGVAIGCWMRSQRNRALTRIVAEGMTGSRPNGGSGVGTVPVGFYSDFSPFVGAGVRYGSWPLTLDLKPEAESGSSGGGAEPVADTGPAPEPTAHPGPELVEKLYTGLHADLTGLSEDGDPLSTHRSVDLADCVFVPGVRTDRPSDVRRRMLTGDGTGHVRPDWVRALMHSSHERVRHFLEVGVSMWESQIVVTSFVRLSLHGGSLRVEGETFVMPPVSECYGVPEEEQPTGEDAEGRVGVFGSAVANLFGDARTAVAELGAAAASQWRASGIKRKEAGLAAQYRARPQDSGMAGEEALLAQRIRRQGGASRPMDGRPEQRYVALVDYAPRISIRELAADPHYQQLFQRHDVQRVTGAVTKRCLTSLVRVLKDNGYDTGELEGAAHNITIGMQNFGTANVDGVVSAGTDNAISQQPPARRSGGAGSAPPQM